jgi:hypothetical protein
MSLRAMRKSIQVGVAREVRNAVKAKEIGSAAEGKAKREQRSPDGKLLVLALLILNVVERPMDDLNRREI